MTDVLVILDGATEPIVDDEPTSLERAATPVLDALAQNGTLRRLQTIPDGLPAGSETGCAVLLGWTPPSPVDRGALEAGARGFPPAHARRVDLMLPSGERPELLEVNRIISELRTAHPPIEAHPLGGHRLLLWDPQASALPKTVGGMQLHLWPAGILPPEDLLDGTTTVVGAPGAATGLGALLGAQAVTVARAAAGNPRELPSLASAALEEFARGGIARLVIHAGGADEAAHALDADRKVAFLERADEHLIAPLAAAIHEHGGTLEVTADHGTDPRTGEHDAIPVPALRWDPEGDADEGAVDDGNLTDDDLPVLATAKRRASAAALSGRRLTERWALPLPIERPIQIEAGIR